MSIFSYIVIFFRHLKLEIALAIPALNDENIKTNNSATQGLTIDTHTIVTSSAGCFV